MPKKSLYLASLGTLLGVVAWFGLAAQPVAASAYPTSPYDSSSPYKIAGCVMVNTQAEMDSSHVYTLAPDVLYDPNNSYRELWNRNARCDELQFHASHGTSNQRLRAWLVDVAKGWFRNIGTSHLKGQTVSTSRHEIFFIDQNGAHRIYDWPTAMSWGLLIADRVSISDALKEPFYTTASFGTPLNFHDGRYRDAFHDVWRDGERELTVFPDRMADEIEMLMGNENNVQATSREVFQDCSYVYSSPGDPYGALFDWDWMGLNESCS